MKPSLLAPLLCLLFAANFLCAQPKAPKALHPKEIAELIRQAGRNDRDAAFKLSVFYGATMGDDRSHEAWLRIAAGMEHPIAEFNLAFMLLSRIPSDTEGLRLLEKRVKAGDKDAIEYRESLAKRRPKENETSLGR